MNDSAQYPFQNSTPPRKNRRPLLIIPLILLVVLVGLGIRHLQHAQKGNASDVLTSANNNPDTMASVTPPPSAPPAPKADTSAPAVAFSAPVANEGMALGETSHPLKKRMRHHSAPVSDTSAAAISSASPAAPAPAVSSAPEPTPVQPPPSIAPSSPHKSFALEDQPPPAKASLSEEGQLAVNTMPPSPEASETPASPVLSDAFRRGDEAYHRQDYAGAIAGFQELPKPTTRQRGNPTRDQYVEGNFLMGLSLLQVDKAADAVNAFLTVLDYQKYDPVTNMNLGICYVELKQYFKANKAFEAVVRDQGYIDSPMYDDVMQRTKYFWALAWTRMYKATKDSDKRAYYQQQALMRWKDYQVWFGKDARYRAENRRAEGYAKSLST